MNTSFNLEKSQKYLSFFLSGFFTYSTCIYRLCCFRSGGRGHLVDKMDKSSDTFLSTDINGIGDSHSC